MSTLGYGRSYRKYKESTNICVSWVIEQGKKHGFQLPFQNATAHAAVIDTSIRLKGKQRKLAKSKALAAESAEKTELKGSISVSVSTLTSCIKYLAAQDVIIKMPLRVQRHLHRAITLREQCTAEHIQESNDNEDSKSTKEHTFFTNTLKEIQHVFPYIHPRMPDLKDNKETIPIDNLFNNLELDDICSSDDIDTTPDHAQPSQGTTVEAAPSYELEQSQLDNWFLLLWCNKLDEYNIFKFLSKSWKVHQEGNLDLVTVALLTEVVMKIVEKTHGELEDMMPDSAMEQNTPTVAVLQIEGNFDGKMPEIFKTDYNYTNEVAFLGADCRWADPGKHAVPSRLPIDGTSSKYTPSMVGLLSSTPYVVLTQMKLDVLWVSIGQLVAEHFFERDGRVISTSTDTLITQVLGRGASYLDVYTKMFDENLQSGSSIAQGFMIRILLDIHQILGTGMRDMYQKLLDYAIVARNCLLTAHSKEIQSNVKDERRIRHLWGGDEAYDQAIATSWYAENAFKDSTLTAMKRRLVEGEGSVGNDKCKCCSIPAMQRYPGRIWPSKDLHFFYKHNPVYCGMERLKLDLCMEKSGTLLVVQRAEITIMAHVYNTLKRQGKLDVEWVALEYLMEKFKSELFCGDFPTTPDDIVKRYLICTGAAKASSFAPRAKRPTEKKTWRFPVIFTPSPASATLCDFMAQKITPDQLLYEIYKISNKKYTFKKHEGKDDLLELLQVLKETVDASIPQIRVNYIKLHQQCHTILKLMETMLRSKYEITFESEMVWHGANILRCATGGDASYSEKQFRLKPAQRQQLLNDMQYVLEAFLGGTKGN